MSPLSRLFLKQLIKRIVAVSLDKTRNKRRENSSKRETSFNPLKLLGLH